MKRFLFLVVLGILAAGMASAQGRPSVISPPDHPCPAGVEFVAAHADGYPDHWLVAVLCDRSVYEQSEKLWKAAPNVGAFTVLSARRTYILFEMNSSPGKLQEQTLLLLAHELRHIHCMCDLGEEKRK